MERAMIGFHQDGEGHWVADLVCGHTQHVRHQPPFTLRPWVLTPESRAERVGQCLDCLACDRRELPKGHAPYHRTPTFTRESVPDALLRRHETKAGVWGLVCVTSGELEFVEADPGGERRQLVKVGEPAVIRPLVEHRLAPLGPVEVHVELWRGPPRGAHA